MFVLILHIQHKTSNIHYTVRSLRILFRPLAVIPNHAAIAMIFGHLQCDLSTATTEVSLESTINFRKNLSTRVQILEKNLIQSGQQSGNICMAFHINVVHLLVWLSGSTTLRDILTGLLENFSQYSDSKKASDIAISCSSTYKTYSNHRYDWNDQTIYSRISPCGDTTQKKYNKKSQSCCNTGYSY